VIAPRRLRAPQHSGAIVAEPPLASAGNLLSDNRKVLAEAPAPLLGRSWDELRAQARQAAVSCAQDYLRSAGEPTETWGNNSLVMAGHQPDLFHPGVWIKNFALHGLARAHNATPINLVVDNDTAKSTALRVPTCGNEHNHSPHVVQIPFDHWTGEVPYEERPVRDERLFESLPDNLAPLTKEWGFVPLLPRLWDEARRQAKRTQFLGERVVAARRSIERQWGCHNLELPVSLLCRTEPFAWFTYHLLSELPRFHAVHNACVHEYRQTYGIRSRNHPVPDLASEGDWLEAPFWGWRADTAARRGRLFCRLRSHALELRLQQGTWPSLPAINVGDPAAGVWALQDLERRGFKVRSRALTNTLFARLFLCDLFVHGIGGGKYDELTDEIIRRFYGCRPPAFLVLSGTLLLPLETAPGPTGSCRRLRHELRDIYYNPQRHLANGAQETTAERELAAQKAAWIVRPTPDARRRKERFENLRALTEKLRTHVGPQATAVEQQLVQCEHRLHLSEVMLRRDYPFCLYPEESLRSFCTQFLEITQAP
jgi:hypothetical protein